MNGMVRQNGMVRHSPERSQQDPGYHGDVGESRSRWFWGSAESVEAMYQPTAFHSVMEEMRWCRIQYKADTECRRTNGRGVSDVSLCISWSFGFDFDFDLLCFSYCSYEYFFLCSCFRPDFDFDSCFDFLCCCFCYCLDFLFPENDHDAYVLATENRKTRLQS